jgi:endonuclease VIII
VPEGHTIHRLAKDQTKDLVGGAVCVSSPQGRMTQGAQLVDGLVLKRIEAYGKHLFYRFGHVNPKNAVTIHVHLGLFGKFTRHSDPAPAPRDTVRMRLAANRITVDLTGPTDCRVLDHIEELTIRNRLGPDPLRTDADPETAWERLHKRKSTVGEALMDQKVMAGVGNVYRAESLFVHGIHPNRPANQISKHQFEALWSTICAMLATGVRDNRIITVATDELATFGVPRAKLRGKEAVYVYKKDHCLRCQSAITRWDLSGRWAYACPTCQPE